MKPDKRKQTAQWKPRKMCDQCGCQHPGLCRNFMGPCFGCGNMGHKVANRPKATRNSQDNIQKSGIGINPAVQQGRPPADAPLGDNKSNQKPLTGSWMLS